MRQILERYSLTFIRVYLGAFNFASGANHYIQWRPRPTAADPFTQGYVDAATASGLFDAAKILELIAGAMLIFNVAPAAALVLLMPVTATIFGLNVFSSPLPHIKASGARNMLFHLILLGAYAGYYYPMMKLRAKPSPFWRKPGLLIKSL